MELRRSKDAKGEEGDLGQFEFVVSRLVGFRVILQTNCADEPCEVILLLQCNWGRELWGLLKVGGAGSQLSRQSPEITTRWHCLDRLENTNMMLHGTNTLLFLF